MHTRSVVLAGPVLAICALLYPVPGPAWGDEGHRIVGRIALPLLTPAARMQVDALLAADDDALTAPDFVSRTVGADRWRDSDRNTTKVRYTATQQWHFVDIEITHPDLSDACAGQRPLPEGTPASRGPARDCVVDKVEQFAAELADTTLPQAERILALKYLLHFTGDLHQPLHSADNQDQGGNQVQVLYGPHHVASRLHAYWDTAVVQRIGRDEAEVAEELTETFAAATNVAYALPAARVPDEHGTPAYVLGDTYKQRAAAAREQLAKAGFRLAALLNAALH